MAGAGRIDEVACGLWIATRQQHGARWRANRAVRDDLGEQRAFTGQAIDLGCIDLCLDE